MKKKTIRIEKPNPDAVFWTVNAEGATYNTEISIAMDVTAMIYCGSRRALSTGTVKTLGGIFNPEKEKKFLAGNKSMDCTIYALDETSEFEAEWGVGGIKVAESDTKILRTAQSYGKYFFQIVNLFNFIEKNSRLLTGVLMKEDIKKLYREKIHALISGEISNELNSKDILRCQSMTNTIAEKIKDNLNKVLKSDGVQLNSLVISRIAYSQQDEKINELFNEERINVELIKIKNQGSRDDISVTKDYVDAVKPLLRPQKGEAQKKFIVCSRCREENDNASIYCKKCGEKLI